MEAKNIANASINISFNFIEIFRPICLDAIFRALFITLTDFVRLMSTIINLKRIVWSACGHNQIPVIRVLSVLFPPALK